MTIKEQQTQEDALFFLEQSMGSKLPLDVGLDLDLNPEIKSICFVPDHLEFGTEEGVQIFQLRKSNLETHYMVRNP